MATSSSKVVEVLIWSHGEIFFQGMVSRIKASQLSPYENANHVGRRRRSR